MFPYSQRLHSSEDIVKVLRNGERSRCGFVTVFYTPNRHNLTRVAVILDKKVSKKAVIRNMWKRRTRAILKTLPLPTADITVRLYSPIECSDYSTLKDQVEQCIQKIHSTQSSS